MIFKMIKHFYFAFHPFIISILQIAGQLLEPVHI